MLSEDLSPRAEKTVQEAAAESKKKSYVEMIHCGFTCYCQIIQTPPDCVYQLEAK